MISLELFKQKVEDIKDQMEKISVKTDNLVDMMNNTFFTDCYAVPNNWIYDIVEDEFQNLVMALRDDVDWNKVENREAVDNFFEYWVYDQEFGGAISTMKDAEAEAAEWNIGKTYNLDSVEEVYNYLKEGLLKQ